MFDENDQLTLQFYPVSVKPEPNRRVLVRISHQGHIQFRVSAWMPGFGWSDLDDDYYYKGVTHWAYLPQE
jgi:hypothetical protein